MRIKQIPIGIKDYFNDLKNQYNTQYNTNLQLLESYKKECDELYDTLLKKENIYKKQYNINLSDYKEFKENKYSNGSFFTYAKGCYLNNRSDFEHFGASYDVYKLAKLQKDIHDITKQNELNLKLANIGYKEYLNIIKTFYTEVQRQLILEGNGYSLGQVGWFCINRCVIEKARPMLDFAATKKRKEELKSSGAKVYNKVEANWCKERGIEYKAADVRVFKKDDHCYEVPLISCLLPNGSDYKLTVSDYRGSSLRGKTNQNLIDLCNKDPKEICKLDIDLRTKLTLCEQVDKILYNKFIRNENQQPSTHRSSNRKD